MANEVLKTIRSRRSVRAYKRDAVPQELLREICEAGTYAPTGGGRQSPTIIAVTNEKYRNELARLNAEKKRLEGEIKRVEGKLSNAGFVSKAPQKLVDEERAKGENYKEMLNKVLENIKNMENM